MTSSNRGQIGIVNITKTEFQPGSKLTLIVSVLTERMQLLFCLEVINQLCVHLNGVQMEYSLQEKIHEYAFGVPMNCS